MWQIGQNSNLSQCANTFGNQCANTFGKIQTYFNVFHKPQEFRMNQIADIPAAIAASSFSTLCLPRLLS